jgi:hypothetical protein
MVFGHGARFAVYASAPGLYNAGTIRNRPRACRSAEALVATWPPRLEPTSGE